MQAADKALQKVEQELIASENDGAISLGFRKVFKEFLDIAEAEGGNADSLCQYFVTKILTLFVKTFIKSREENEKQAEADKKKLEKDATKETPLAKKDDE